MFNLLKYLITHPRVICWIIWLLSQGLFFHIFYSLGHKADFGDCTDIRTHIVLSICSTLGFVANGSILFRLVPVFRTGRMKWLHLAVFVIAFELGCWDLVRLYIITQDVKHFSSAHSIFGFLTYVIFILMSLASVYQFTLTSQYTRKLLSGCHAFSGFVVILMALFAAASGCQKVILHVEKKYGEITKDLMFNMYLVKFEIFCYFGLIYFILLDPLFDWETIGNI